MIKCIGKLVKRINKTTVDGKQKFDVLTVLAPDMAKLYYLTDYDGYSKTIEIGEDFAFTIRVTSSKAGFPNMILDAVPEGE